MAEETRVMLAREGAESSSSHIALGFLFLVQHCLCLAKHGKNLSMPMVTKGSIVTVAQTALLSLSLLTQLPLAKFAIKGIAHCLEMRDIMQILEPD